MNRKVYFKPADIIIYIILLVICLSVLWLYTSDKHKGAENVEIYINSVLKYRYSINENRVVNIKSEFGKDEIVINNKKVRIRDADCPDKLCVKQGKISSAGEMIVCIPGRLVVKVTGTNQELDGVIR